MKKFLLSSVYPKDTSAGWKLDDNGAIVLKDGNPVYVDSNGREMVMKHDTIANLNSEAKTLREAKEKAEGKLKDYDGLDAKIAREAIEKLGKIDAKQLIDAGKVDEVKAQIQQQYQGQLDEQTAQNKQLQSRIDDMQVNSVFSQSDFVRNNIAVPRDMFEASFRNSFKVEDGKVVAYDKSGNVLMSKKNIGEIATPDEALHILVESHPQKDVILKADMGSGSGSDGGGGNRGAGRVINRADFTKLAPGKQAEVAAKVRAGEMTLTD